MSRSGRLLRYVLARIGLGDAGDIVFRWDDSAGGPVIVGEVTPARTLVAEADGVSVGLPAGSPVRVLESFRHRPDDLAALLAAQRMEVLELAISPSGEEGVAVGLRP